MTIDEMHIMEWVEYVGDRVYGYINLGTSAGMRDDDNDSQEKSNGMLVIMAVSLNSHWKVPLGYFAIKSLSGKERANLITLALTQLHDANVKCCSLTFDGEPANIAMTNTLGACLKWDTDKYKPWFMHPNGEYPVYIYPDPSHMLKLVRNTLGEKSPLKDELGRIIDWFHMKELHVVQVNEGLHAANKISKRHINYANENKMNVRLATQTLSHSVSCSLRMLRDMHGEDTSTFKTFKTAQPTADYCDAFNDAFDILNCRNLLSFKMFKLPLNRKNYEKLNKRASELQHYIEHLKAMDGTFMYESQCKCGFVGFLTCLDVIFLIFEQVEKWGMSFLLTYKLLQDALENFFSAVRSKGGHNNNPTRRQFEVAYKRLMVHGIIKTSDKSNCILDNLDMLQCTKLKRKEEPPTDEFHQPTEEEDFLFALMEHDYLSPSWACSKFVMRVLAYIGGFVVRRVSEIFCCDTCKTFLVAQGKVHELDQQYALIRQKTHGKLIAPSEDVIHILKSAEKIFRKKIHEMKKKDFDHQIISYVLMDVGGWVFDSPVMKAHFIENDPLADHRVELIKVIAQRFLKSRKNYEAKCASQPDVYVRHKNTKSTIFSGQ